MTRRPVLRSSEALRNRLRPPGPTRCAFPLSQASRERRPLFFLPRQSTPVHPRSGFRRVLHSLKRPSRNDAPFSRKNAAAEVRAVLRPEKNLFQKTCLSSTRREAGAMLRQKQVSLKRKHMRHTPHNNREGRLLCRPSCEETKKVPWGDSPTSPPLREPWRAFPTTSYPSSSDDGHAAVPCR